MVIGEGYTIMRLRPQSSEQVLRPTENVSRPRLTLQADHMRASLDEILYVNLTLIRNISNPKSRIKVLFALKMSTRLGLIFFNEEGY